MGRRPRNTLPASKEVLRPGTHDTQKVRRHFAEQKAKQKFYYDHRRGVKELPPLDKGAPVRISPLPGTNNWLPGKVTTHYNKPRSYVVQAGNRLYRRNLKHLRVSTELANATRDDDRGHRPTCGHPAAGSPTWSRIQHTGKYTNSVIEAGNQYS